ncbi:hypothetical protein B0919_01650 [Hymenobacter sp. CRA2]|nr:hypothetical protein B0919_01650 [Hymenobacter sp. CRA2]
MGLLPFLAGAQTKPTPAKKAPAAVQLRPADTPVPTGNGPHDSTRVYDFAEQMPLPPGGLAAFEAYLAQHLRLPAEVQSGAVTGKVFVRFVVMPSGRLADLRVTRSLSPAADAEALRVLRDMPRWSPAKQNGAVASVAYSLPINFAPAKTK